jgi:tRNA-splicing ligase RtcB
VSFKYIAQKISDSQYVLPKVGTMKTDAKVFFSEELYEASEENYWKQLHDAASYEGVTGVYGLPDGHSGFGVPIGCVIVTDGTLIQAGSGYDINCGIICLKVNLTANSVKSFYKREQWIREVEKRVSSGIGSGRPKLMPTFSDKKVQEILRYGAKALGAHKEICERQYIPVPDEMDFTVIEKAYAKVSSQLGSAGGGNHHCELQVDQDSGDVYVMVHCGSRGYGYQTAEHFFYAGAELRGLPKNRREDSWLRIDEPLGKEYWAYHNSAANFAIANRHIIISGIKDALQEVFNADSEVYYEISHNLIQEETLILPDGSTTKGFVHRKGATRAFPAGHPDLIGTIWEKTGHPCLIPGSMYDGAAILFAEPGAHQSACSVNHGSGRKMARGEARRKLEHKQLKIDDDMKTVKRKLGGVEIEGIAINNKHTPLDECSHVYKDLDTVLEVLTTNNIARIDKRLYPVANIKGVD